MHDSKHWVGEVLRGEVLLADTLGAEGLEGVVYWEGKSLHGGLVGAVQDFSPSHMAFSPSAPLVQRIGASCSTGA